MGFLLLSFLHFTALWVTVSLLLHCLDSTHVSGTLPATTWDSPALVLHLFLCTSHHSRSLEFLSSHLVWNFWRFSVIWITAGIFSHFVFLIFSTGGYVFYSAPPALSLLSTLDFPTRFPAHSLLSFLSFSLDFRFPTLCHSFLRLFFISLHILTSAVSLGGLYLFSLLSLWISLDFSRFISLSFFHSFGFGLEIFFHFLFYSGFSHSFWNLGSAPRGFHSFPAWVHHFIF